MGETYDAVVNKIKYEGGTPRTIVFGVESPPNVPDFFYKDTDEGELSRLARKTEPAEHGDQLEFDIGSVPLRFDSGWAIAWDQLED